MPYPRNFAVKFSLAVVLFLAVVDRVCFAQGQSSAPGAYPVKTISNLAYYTGPDADPKKHKLDLYLPEGKTDAPVFFFVHGGAWTIGDKNQFGIPARVGKALARNGIAMVSINYRLSPKVKHPEHILDVARAFAWTHQNIGKYGGCKEEIFISGHSAGGHLVALLATDEQYLREHSLGLNDIAGVIPISGIFQITPHRAFNAVFGKEPTDLKQASPINHARPNAPPFLVICAAEELPGCDKVSAQAFCQALKEKQAAAQFLEVKNRNHVTVWFQAPSENDPVHQAITSFIISHVALRRLASDGPAGLDVLQHFLLGK